MQHHRQVQHQLGAHHTELAINQSQQQGVRTKLRVNKCRVMNTVRNNSTSPAVRHSRQFSENFSLIFGTGQNDNQTIKN